MANYSYTPGRPTMSSASGRLGRLTSGNNLSKSQLTIFHFVAKHALRTDLTQKNWTVFDSLRVKTAASICSDNLCDHTKVSNCELANSLRDQARRTLFTAREHDENQQSKPLVLESSVVL